MDDNVIFYLLDGLASSNPNKTLKSRLRILTVPMDFPHKFNATTYSSLIDLRKKDERWKALNFESSKIANKICEPRFILDAHDCIFTPANEKFNPYSYDILRHTLFGEFDKDLRGIHLITKLNKDILLVNQIKAEDKYGVWEAEITVINKRRNKEYKKKSTLFPKSWTPTHFMYEICHAIEKINIVSTKSKYRSETRSGVPIELFIENSKLKTTYPLYTI